MRSLIFRNYQPVHKSLHKYVKTLEGLESLEKMIDGEQDVAITQYLDESAQEKIFLRKPHKHLKKDLQRRMEFSGLEAELARAMQKLITLGDEDEAAILEAKEEPRKAEDDGKCFEEFAQEEAVDVMFDDD
eukprot:GHVP01030719.1.p1 GENE.GHVP01030719.1~~GHVP01030719.1.p1  ORF type:complete len:131 (-),score=36.46 GHVP01030719.1:29-421(-)